MEALEEVVGVPSKDLFHIVKGKRTKRLRQNSPNFPFSSVITTSSSHDSFNACNDNRKDDNNIPSNNNSNNNNNNNNNNNVGDDVACNNNNNGNSIIERGSGNGEGIDCNNNNDNNNNNNNNNEILSSVASSETFINTFTEEEEETAKCLVLMSKGRASDDNHHHHHHHPQLPRPLDNNNNVDFFNNDNLRLYKTKFNSKRYIETSNNSLDGTKAGIYVYECKTCNRTFSSFQALGGHRASHKKPKTLLNTEFNRKAYLLDLSDEDDYQQHSLSTTTLYNNKNNNKNLPNSSNNNKYYYSSSSPRVHECSYCGAEFTSGQALGGHMRRHRGGANVNSPLQYLSNSNNLSPATTSMDHHHQEFGKNNNNSNDNITMKKQKDHNELSLDLNNLPVQDDHPVVSLKQQDNQEQTQRQLVDCHY